MSIKLLHVVDIVVQYKSYSILPYYDCSVATIHVREFTNVCLHISYNSSM